MKIKIINNHGSCNREPLIFKTMRKLFLILALVFVSLVSNAQQTIDTYAVEFGVWDTDNKEWVWDEAIETDISFTMKGMYLYASDVAESTYFLYDKLMDKRNYISWMAVDEEQIECVITISTVDDQPFVIVMYDDTCYRYSW